MNLIPSHESDEQKNLEDLGTKILNRFDSSKLTVNPLECDESLLPHLAVSLDVIISGLDVDEARVLLQYAREIKRFIGSKWAVNKAASSIFGENIKVRPWNEVGTAAGTYKIEVDVTPKKPVTDENLDKAIRLIDEAKPVSRHLAGITINMANSGLYKQAATTISSETINVLPKILKDVAVSMSKKLVVASHTIEIIELKPKGV